MALPAYQDPQEDDESAAPSLELEEGAGNDESAASQRPDLHVVESGGPNLQVVEGGQATENEFAQPASTTLTPPEPVRPEGEADLTGGVGKNVDAREQAGLTPGATAVSGQPKILDPEASREAAAEKQGKPGEKGQEKGLREKYQDLRADIKEKREEIKNAATKQAKSIAKKYIRDAVIDFLVTTFPAWGPVVGIILLIILLVIGIAIGVSLLLRGNTPPNNFNVAYGSEFNRTAANPDGIYLRQMTPIYTLPDEHGTPVKISVESTAGGIGVEDPAHLSGNTIQFKDGSLSPFSGRYDIGGKKIVPFTQQDADYYVNMRWPYVNSVAWNGSFKLGVHTSYAAGKYYGGRKVIVYNPTTKKAAVGSAGEWGPRPWAGVCAGETSDQSNKSNPRNTDSSCTTQRGEWGAIGRMGPDGDFHPPADYTGRVAGLAPALAQLVGADTDQVVIIGFAKDQNLPLGSLPVTDADVIHATDLAGLSTASGVLQVPGVEEVKQGDCGLASTDMIGLYYQSDKGTTLLNYSDLQSSFQKYLSSNKPVSPNAWFATRGDPGTCSINDNLTEFGGKVPSDWVRISIDGQPDLLRSAIVSIEHGDPVAMYTDGAIYSGPHIIALVGWDGAKQEFVINNPYVHGVDLGVHGSDTGSQKQPLTLDYLYQHRGDQLPQYANPKRDLIIRCTYVNQCKK